MEPSAEERLRQMAGPPVPETPMPSAPVQQQASFPPVPPRRSRIMPLLSGIVLLFVLLIVGFASAIVYASVDVPFMSPEQEKTIHLLMYRVPLIPKTSRQILLAASENQTSVTKYTPEYSMSGTVSNTAVSLASFDVKIAGPVDFTPGSPAAFDLTLDGSVSVAGTAYTASGKIQKTGDAVYGKIDALSDSIVNLYVSYGALDNQSADSEEIVRNLKDVFTNWVMYDTSSIESEARKALTDRTQDQSLIDSTRRDAQKVLLGDAILKDVKKLPDDSVDSTSVYHLQYAPNSEGIRNVLGVVYEVAKEKSSPTDVTMTDEETTQMVDMISSSIKKLTVDVWIGKDDAIMRRTSVQLDVSLSGLQKYIGFSDIGTSYSSSTSPADMIAGQLTDITLSTSLILTIRNIGGDVAVTPPAKALNVQDYSSLLQNALITEEQRKKETMREQYDADFTVLQGELTKYYAKNFVFPETLSVLQSSAGISQETGQRLSDYLYQRSVNGQEYVLYVEFDAYSTAQSGLYGITSDSSYPRQLGVNDLKIVQESDPVLIPETPKAVLISPPPYVYGVMDAFLR